MFSGTSYPGESLDFVTFAAMKPEKKQWIGYGMVAAFLLLVVVLRMWSDAAEWYALHVYPTLSFVLSGFSSRVPFSLGDLFISGSLIWVIVYPFYAKYRKYPWKRTLLRVAGFLLWIYVWFYLAWGVNYFRKDFYTRASVTPAAFSQEEFRAFLDGYVAALNASFVPAGQTEPEKVAAEVKKGYREIAGVYGMARPHDFQQVKTMLFTPFISMVGISGYMGPFFSEFNLNGDLLPPQYASTYAHEMAHLLGIASEAEANLYAYLVCTAADDPRIRFSGYLSLLPHVLRNARNFLFEEEYGRLVASVDSAIRTVYETNRAYWQEKYSSLAGGIQDVVYDWFLKGNRIQSGRQNYSEVIGLLISVQRERK